MNNRRNKTSWNNQDGNRWHVIAWWRKPGSQFLPVLGELQLEKKGGKKSAGAFVLIRYGLEERSEKYSSHKHYGEELNKSGRCIGELSSGQGGKRVAESTAADASQINIMLKCCKNCQTFSCCESASKSVSLILGFRDEATKIKCENKWRIDFSYSSKCFK